MKGSRQTKGVATPYSEEGFSLLEVLIAMQLGILVIGLALWSYNFGNKVILSWQYKNSVAIQQASIEKILRTTLDRIVVVDHAKEKEFTGRTVNQDTLHINLRGNILRVNGKEVCKTTQMVFQYYYLLSNDTTKMPSVPSDRLQAICAMEISGRTFIEKGSQPLSIVKRLIWGETQKRSASSE